MPKNRNNSGKGSAFERRICNSLSLWVSDFSRKDIFWRSAMSGGRTTVHKKKGVILRAQAGDINAVHEMGFFLTNLFMMECKHYKDLGWLAALYGKNKVVVEFWLKLQSESNEFEKSPMLIAKQNNKADLVCFDRIGASICINNKIEPLFIIPRIGMQAYLLRDLLLLPFDEIRNRNAGKRIRQRVHLNHR